jgi:hypothetical protein
MKGTAQVVYEIPRARRGRATPRALRVDQKRPPVFGGTRHPCPVLLLPARLTSGGGLPRPRPFRQASLKVGTILARNSIHLISKPKKEAES